ncbi:spore gernimation protein GerPD [Gracilibacillus marinus]|uniref:Spore gernimation protein GerPD n=1 Tax=Gracilibacillus marinus TaxID=630535 RepID=A0ABV8VS47_9BACI
MQYHFYNWSLGVGNISLLGLSGSSLFIVGDSENIYLSSLFDTPPESYIVGAEMPPMIVGDAYEQTND